MNRAPEFIEKQKTTLIDQGPRCAQGRCATSPLGWRSREHTGLSVRGELLRAGRGARTCTLTRTLTRARAARTQALRQLRDPTRRTAHWRVD